MLCEICGIRNILDCGIEHIFPNKKAESNLHSTQLRKQFKSIMSYLILKVRVPCHVAIVLCC
jgi:hypothetical protein